MIDDTHSVLIVTRNPELSSKITSLLIPPLFDVNLVQNFSEARRRTSDRVFDIVIVDYADGDGLDYSMDIASSTSIILLLVPSEKFDQISYKVESSGILTTSTPFEQYHFYNILKLAIAVKYKVQNISRQAVKLKERMNEIRLVNRAKMLLMENLALTEEQSHHYIEKEAMNSCMRKMEVAEDIIRKYEK